VDVEIQKVDVLAPSDRSDRRPKPRETQIGRSRQPYANDQEAATGEGTEPWRRWVGRLRALRPCPWRNGAFRLLLEAGERLKSDRPAVAPFGVWADPPETGVCAFPLKPELQGTLFLARAPRCELAGSDCAANAE